MENLNVESFDQYEENLPKSETYTENLKDIIARVGKEPRMKMIYPGIKENSIGFVFGPAKSGKTIMCENLGLSIAAGLDNYLGKPIEIENRKVAFLSFEEFYRERTERNEKQIARLVEERGDEWLKNYFVLNEKMPRYLHSDDDWQIVKDIIEDIQPGVLFIDSLSRLSLGSIEDSWMAKNLMEQLRELANSTKTTIIVIHHIPKHLYASAITIGSIAGSRIICQDADFLIGVNKTLEGKRYIKDVAFRYASDDCDTVTVIKLNENLWFEKSGDIEEHKLLHALDGRRNDENREKIFQFLKDNAETDEGIVELITIKEHFQGKISSQTISTQLGILVAEERVIKPAHGKYKAII